MGEMVIMNNLEWPMFSYYVIYYEKLTKVMQRTEEEALTHMLTSPLYLQTIYCLKPDINNLLWWEGFHVDSISNPDDGIARGFVSKTTIDNRTATMVNCYHGKLLPW